MKVVAVIPAHNEETVIQTTIEDLQEQTLPVTILVVADNCTDGTADIVRSLAVRYSNLMFLETVDNEYRKAGAINQALQTVDGEVDAILFMDADTRIAEDAVEHAYHKLKQDESLAAVCSKAGVLPITEKVSLVSWILYRLQRLEYSLFDSQRIETWGCIKVVHGMAALHRWKALKEVDFYNERSLVEDYDLTIKYRYHGWRVIVDLEMRAWTEVPITWSAWWKQRLRWNRGGADSLHGYGWNKATRWDIMGHCYINVMLILQWIIITVFTIALIRSNCGFYMHITILIAMLFSLASSIYRMKYLEDVQLSDWLLRIAILPEMVYGYICVLNLYHSYFLFFFNRKQSW